MNLICFNFFSIVSFLCLFFIPNIGWSSPFITISDEFSGENKISYSLNSVAEVKNSDKIFRYTSNNDVVDYNNYNFLSVTSGFRYKIINNMIFKSNFSASYSNISGLSSEGDYYKDSFSFDSVSFGLLYKFNNKSELNKVLSFDIYPVQNYNGNLNYFKSVLGQLSIDKTYDPLITSLDFGFLFNNKMKVENGFYQPSNKIYIQPKVDFLANQFFSLGMGANLSILQAEKFNDNLIRNNTIQNRLIFSLAHTIDERKRWYVEASFDTSGKGGGSLSFTYDADIRK